MLLYRYKSKIVPSENSDLEKVRKIVEIDNVLQFVNDLKKERNKTDFTEFINKHFVIYKKQGGSAEVWINETEKIIEREKDNISTECYFFWLQWHEANTKKEPEQIKSNESRLPFIKDNLRPIVLSLASLNGYD